MGTNISGGVDTTSKDVCCEASKQLKNVPARGGEGIYHVPVAPLLDAVEKVLADAVDVLNVAVAAAVQQREAGLDEGTGGLVQCFGGFTRVSPAQLGLPQDQIHQTDQLVARQLQDKLLCAFLKDERCYLLAM